MNIAIFEKESSNDLSKLADNDQQHAASLNTLRLFINPEVLVHTLENKLPKNTLEKWEATLSRDKFPKLDDMCKTACT